MRRRQESRSDGTGWAGSSSWSGWWAAASYSPPCCSDSCGGSGSLSSSITAGPSPSLNGREGHLLRVVVCLLLVAVTLAPLTSVTVYGSSSYRSIILFGCSFKFLSRTRSPTANCRFAVLNRSSAYSFIFSLRLLSLSLATTSSCWSGSAGQSCFVWVGWTWDWLERHPLLCAG